jgi:hypothetical protein
MSAFKLHTLKHKLWAVIAASFVARVIIYFLLPNRASIALAPDENGYAVIAQDLASLSIFEGFAKFFDFDVLGRTLVVPSSLLIRIGFSDINSVRIISMLFSQSSLILIALFIWKLCQHQEFGKKQQNLLAVPLIFYAIWPSRFLWSSLGLRESSIEFFVVLTFLSVYLFYDERNKNKYFPSIGVCFGITFVFMTRVQVGWLLVTTLLIYCAFKMKEKKTLLLVPLVMFGMILGYFSTTPFAYITNDFYVAKDATLSPTKDATPTNRGEVDASKLCDGTKLKVEYEGRTYNCIKSGRVIKRERPSNILETAIDQVEAIPGKQIVNQIGAASIIQRLSCPFEESTVIGEYSCLAFRAPYMTLTFLFRPLPFIDTTSLSSTFAAAENTLWILMFVSIIYRISKVNRIPFFRELSPSVIFFSLYVVAAGSYEGNMGTAFRHKSLILWVPLLILLALFWDKNSQTKLCRGNNSQESAV